MVKITPRLLRTKFERLRGPDRDIRLWEEFTAAEQASLLKRVALQEQETPVIAVLDSPNPIVVTTARVLWEAENNSHCLQLDRLTAVQAPEAFSKSKLDLSQLLLTDVDGKEHRLQTKPGNPLFIMWNLLLTVTRRRAGVVR